MIVKLQNHMQAHFPSLNEKKLLLATSGGMDSMVMVALFNTLGYQIAIAHCNFQLRGTESFEDQQFVQTYADAHQIAMYSILFDTKAYAENHKKSIQIAARELRYDWFNELIETEGFDFLLTAHHADDAVETFLINLTRGTGLEGLTGIPQQNGNIIRPLLPFSRTEIKNYAEENNIQWREDSSNASDKYIRNKIRHHLIPILKELNPHFLETFQKSQLYLQEAQFMVDDAASMVHQQVVEEKKNRLTIDLKKLGTLDNYNSYLYQWLKEYGFTAWNDIYDLVNAQSGKQIFSESHRLLKDRTTLIVEPLKHSNSSTYSINKNQIEVKIPLNLSICKVNDITQNTNTTIFVDEDQIQYPLQIRKWEEGDFFYPSGMNGKKKISKYFKDEKFSLIDKENTWLLCSKKDIVWIIGHRTDERFKTKENTQHILKIDFKP